MRVVKRSGSNHFRSDASHLLLASLRIAPRGLQMPMRHRANPDLDPRGWDAQGRETAERRWMADWPAIHTIVLVSGIFPGRRTQGRYSLKC